MPVPKEGQCRPAVVLAVSCPSTVGPVQSRLATKCRPRTRLSACPLPASTQAGERLEPRFSVRFRRADLVMLAVISIFLFADIRVARWLTHLIGWASTLMVFEGCSNEAAAAGAVLASVARLRRATASSFLLLHLRRTGLRGHCVVVAAAGRLLVRERGLCIQRNPVSLCIYWWLQ